jgi:hypothetical protein
MRTPRIAALLVSAALVAASPAVAGTVTIQDDLQSGDVPHRDINIKSLTVTYNAKGSSATLRLKDLRKVKRLRLFVGFLNYPTDDFDAPTYGNFLELRINEKKKLKRVNWVIDPDDEFEGYHAEKCRGIKIKPDFAKDLITYTLPKKCARYLSGRGYIYGYASTRKFKATHWDDGSPADSTGDWFGTTYDIRVER